jgi:hypothetical protein
VKSHWMFRTTWRQILPLKYPDHLARAEAFARWGITEDQFDDEISSEAYITWSSRDLVVGRVCELLKSLDLGSHLNRPGSVGGIPLHVVLRSRRLSQPAEKDYIDLRRARLRQRVFDEPE